MISATFQFPGVGTDWRRFVVNLMGIKNNALGFTILVPTETNDERKARKLPEVVLPPLFHCGCVLCDWCGVLDPLESR